MDALGALCIRIFAVSDTVLLHISVALRRRNITVLRNSLAWWL